MLPETKFYTCNYNIRQLIEMVLLLYFLHESDPRRDQQIALIHFVTHALALHLWLKYYFKSFCMKIWECWPYIHLSVVFPSRMIKQDRTYATNTIKWNIPNIWHKSSTKHKEARPDWNDKNDNANYAFVSHGRFYQWLRLPFLKKYSIKCEKI